MTGLLLASQSIGSAAYLAATTVGALIVVQLSGSHALTGLAGFVYMVGGALGAYPAARLMERAGRRVGLSTGFVVGLVGAVLASLAVIVHLLVPFLIGYALMGAARGFTDLSRYAAAEMYAPANRGRAISWVVLGGTVGAVLGPSLVAPLGRWMTTFGHDPLAGPWLFSAALFLVAAVGLFAFLRPDPSEIARQLNTANPVPLPLTVAGRPLRSVGTLLRQPPVLSALAALVLGQLTMVVVMSITSVHMDDHGHGLDEISLVITLHTLGMFGPALISGWLVDRWGRAPVIVTGAALIIVSCWLAPASQNTAYIATALFLLGLGWNFCYVSGGALLTDALTPEERARGQGLVEGLVNATSGFGSLGGGAAFAAVGYGTVATAAMVIALIPLALAVWQWAQTQGAVAPAGD